MEKKDLYIKEASEQIDTDLAWNKLDNKILEAERGIAKPKVISLTYKYYKVASIIFIVGVVVSLLVQFYVQNRYVFVSTGENEVTYHILPEGTVVELNSESTIKYLKKNFEQNRGVELTGEAFFDVVPDSLHAFTVNTQDIEIIVLGTSFNVLTRISKKAEVLVEEGKVLVTSGINTATLLPGEMGFIKDGEVYVTNEYDVNYLAWKLKDITFKETSLKEVVSTIMHAYNCEILILNDNLETLKYTTTISKQPLQKVMKALDSSFDEFKIRNENNKYIIGEY